jgi:hypothetical protein
VVVEEGRVASPMHRRRAASSKRRRTNPPICLNVYRGGAAGRFAQLRQSAIRNV